MAPQPALAAALIMLISTKNPIMTLPHTIPAMLHDLALCEALLAAKTSPAFHDESTFGGRYQMAGLSPLEPNNNNTSQHSITAVVYLSAC